MLSYMFLTLGDERVSLKIEQIWRKYHGLMISEANKILKCHYAADDAVAEAYIKIIRNLDKIQDISSHQAAGFIVKIVKNVSIDIWRKTNKRMEDADEMLENIPDDKSDLLELMVVKESYEAIKQALKSLPDDLKDVVLFNAQGYKHSEIASLLGITEAASKKRLQRAKQELKKVLAGDENGK